MPELGLRRCPYCHTAVAAGEPVAACGTCLAAHHEACWDEGKTCAACGHAHVLRAGGGLATESQRVIFGCLGMLCVPPALCLGTGVFAALAKGADDFFRNGAHLWAPGTFLVLAGLPLALFHASIAGPERTRDLARGVWFRRFLLAVAGVLGLIGLINFGAGWRDALGVGWIEHTVGSWIQFGLLGVPSLLLYRWLDRRGRAPAEPPPLPEKGPKDAWSKEEPEAKAPKPEPEGERA
ncbi:MAG: hypothetical protein R3F62_10445 [Planctomycetota bacterium]